jgi:hypothetical protein
MPFAGGILPPPPGFAGAPPTSLGEISIGD